MAALVLVFLTLAGAALTPDLPPDGDDVSYVTLAQALASGRGYVNSVYPGDPPELQYPPLFPLLLTPVISLFGQNLLLLKLIPALAGALALIAVFALLRPRLGPDRAFLIAALTGTNGYFLSISTQIMSETVYLALSASALLLVRRAAGQGGAQRAAFAGLTIAAAIYARTVGVALVLAGCAALLLSRRRRETLVLAGVVSLLTWPWVWRSIVLRNSYLSQLFHTPLAGTGGHSGPLLWSSRLLYNAPRYAGKVAADLFFHPFLTDVDPYHPLKIALSLLLTAGIAIGLAVAAREAFSVQRSAFSVQNADATLLYLLTYAGVCLIWPYHDARFLLPVLPFLFEHGLRGAQAVGGRIRLRRLAGEAAGLLTVVGLAGGVSIARDNRLQFYTDEMARYREACLWVQERTPPGAVLLCRKPREAAFWSGRRAWWYTGSQPAAELLAAARRTGATHLLINDFPIAGVNLAERFTAVLREGASHFYPVHQTAPPRVTIYEILLE
jgi:4-amino-4-deoxy-L-arabinose transferase-like glycosyltransferase